MRLPSSSPVALSSAPGATSGESNPACAVAGRYADREFFSGGGGRFGEAVPPAVGGARIARARDHGGDAAAGFRSGKLEPLPPTTTIADGLRTTLSARTFSAIRAHVAALKHLRGGGKSDVFNCGYSKGYSVLQVIEAVKRVSGKTFEVRLSPRRPGDVPNTTLPVIFDWMIDEEALANAFCSIDIIASPGTRNCV